MTLPPDHPSEAATALDDKRAADDSAEKVATASDAGGGMWQRRFHCLGLTFYSQCYLLVVLINFPIARIIGLCTYTMGQFAAKAILLY